MAYLFDTDDREESRTRDAGTAPRSGVSGKREFEIFKTRLHQEILRSERKNHPFALLRIAVEAPALQIELSLADALRSSIREYDVLCTVKPDEFLVALPETEERYAEQIAGRIRRSVEEKLWADAVDEAFSANIGIACYPQDGATADDLMESAEHDLRASRKLKKDLVSEK